MQIRGTDLLDIAGVRLMTEARARRALQRVGKHPRGKHVIHVGMAAVEATHCRHCGGLLHRHGWHARWFLDHPIRSQPFKLLLLRRKYRCTTCAKTHVPPHPGFDETWGMTVRLLGHLATVFGHSPLRTLACQYGVDARKLREMRRAGEAYAADRPILCSGAVAVDDHAQRAMGAITLMTDAIDNKFLALALGLDAEAFTACLRRVHPDTPPLMVAMDDNKAYPAAQRRYSSKMIRIDDCFHVARKVASTIATAANAAQARLSKDDRAKLDAVRPLLTAPACELTRSELQAVRRVLELDQHLHQAWQLAQQFYGILTLAPSRDKRRKNGPTIPAAVRRARAARALQTWQADVLAAGMQTDYAALLAFLDRNWEDFLNYFETGHSTGFTEKLNDLARQIWHRHRGFGHHKRVRTRTVSGRLVWRGYNGHRAAARVATLEFYLLTNWGWLDASHLLAAWGCQPAPPLPGGEHRPYLFAARQIPLTPPQRKPHKELDRVGGVQLAPAA